MTRSNIKHDDNISISQLSQNENNRFIFWLNCEIDFFGLTAYFVINIGLKRHYSDRTTMGKTKHLGILHTPETH